MLINLKKWIKKDYERFFGWFISGKIFDDEEVVGQVHRLLFTIILTSALMWSYLFNAYFCVDSYILTVIGATCTLLHILSPLIYRVTGSISLATSTFVFAGFLFQFSHSFFTGGFQSNTLIWFSILPLIAGIINGKKALIYWTIFAFLSVAILFFIDEHTVFAITKFGEMWAQLNIAVGYILVNFVLMFSYIYFKNKNKKELHDKNESIKKLLRIVSHDIANPLTTVMGKNSLMQLKIEDGNFDGLEDFCLSIEKSSLMIKEILDQSRNLQAINVGKIRFDIIDVSLNDIIENSKFVFNEKINNKNIKIDYDFEKHKDLMVKAEPIAVKNQVFNNLFSNSLKFMDLNGTISISVEVNDNYVLIIYHDN
jgi:signal transduction histidine kinase